jgi:hypothetical protein
MQGFGSAFVPKHFILKAIWRNRPYPGNQPFFET